jgi:hypothetical protein
VVYEDLEAGELSLISLLFFDGIINFLEEKVTFFDLPEFTRHLGWTFKIHLFQPFFRRPGCEKDQCP